MTQPHGPLVNTRGSRRGLTLVEVLLAVFILGIGVISVAALFPAGIAQQRQSADDVIGAIVAENAFAQIRTRVDPAGIGWPRVGPGWTGSDPNQPTNHMSGSIPGDFGWSRPGFVTAAAGVTIDGVTIPQGSILVFNPVGGSNAIGGATPSEVPWNEFVYGAAPPPIVFTQRDRYFPMAPTYTASGAAPPRPQYVWETMFRRFQGRTQVAIFVYRVTRPGSEAREYVVQPNPSQPTVPPLPIRLSFGPLQPVISAAGPDGNLDTLADNAIVPGTLPGSPFELDNDAHAWQLPGQWLLDQDNAIHRVISGRRRVADGPVTLVRAAPILRQSPVYFQFFSSAVSDLWYIPLKDSLGNTLTPVFVTVREL